MRRAVFKFIFVAVWMLALPALADGAAAAFDRGVALYTAQRYNEAVREFQAAYAKDKQQRYLFAWAQAARMSGDCVSAVAIYHTYLRLGLTDQQREAANKGIAACASKDPSSVKVGDEKAVEPDAAAHAPESGQTATPNAADSTHPMATPASPRTPWYRDTLGGVLTGAGVAALGVGIFYLAQSSGSEGDANRAQDYASYSASIHDARGQNTIGWVGVAAGVGLIGAGVVRYIMAGPAETATANVEQPASNKARLNLGFGWVGVERKF